MFICNLHCQLFLRISGNMLHKEHVPMQNFPLYLKKAGLASRNIVHVQKNILRCVGFCLYILHFIYETDWSNAYEQDHRSGCLPLKHFMFKNLVPKAVSLAKPEKRSWERVAKKTKNKKQKSMHPRSKQSDLVFLFLHLYFPLCRL